MSKARNGKMAFMRRARLGLTSHVRDPEGNYVSFFDFFYSTVIPTRTGAGAFLSGNKVEVRHEFIWIRIRKGLTHQRDASITQFFSFYGESVGDLGGLGQGFFFNPFVVIVEGVLVPFYRNRFLRPILVMENVLGDLFSVIHHPESAGLQEVNGLEFLADRNADLVGAMVGPCGIEIPAIPVGASGKGATVEPDDSPDVESRIVDRLEFFGNPAPGERAVKFMEIDAGEEKTLGVKHS